MQVASQDTNRSVYRGNWLTADPLEDCRAALNRKPFRMTHTLSNHPLFAMDALLRVARAAVRRKSDVYFDAGDVGIEDKWGKIPVPDRPVEEIIRRVEHAGAWIVMKHVESDPAYAEVLQEWVGVMRTLAGDAAPLLTNPELIVFITSPHRVTPFHFDLEVNVLVQLHGDKTLWVCDPNDRSIVSETDIEQYYAKSITAGQYNAQAAARASKFRLRPGDAVHIPMHGAHWVRNGDEVSVSLSLNFELPRSACADIYLANHHLRRLGLAPRPPGQSRLADQLKAGAIQAARSAKHIARWAH